MENEGQKNAPDLSVAVIGLSGKFPGARDLTEFWHNLKGGHESVTFFSDEELLASGIGEFDLQNPNYVKAKGVLGDLEYFDAGFFGYSPREATAMDPQTRLFLECSWEALESAGCDPERYQGLLGIYAGARNNNIWMNKVIESNLFSKAAPVQLRSLIEKGFLATKVAYHLNSRGPALTLDTACSTSLVAIHLACRALLTGECDLALAGGVSVRLPKNSGYLHQKGNIYSADGHNRTFDAGASGTVFSDGIGIVVLKRLKDALEQKDNILAVIKGTSVNNDGRSKAGYSAPSVLGQARVISGTLEVAGLKAEAISYLEAHGTATALGDAVEIEALRQAFNTQKKQYCAIGSVKSNIGHTDIAAGVAGFIKTVLALKNGLIPPNLHFETPNPKIDFKNSPFYVAEKPIKWKRQGKVPRRAGVSSFGVGGTNAHIILEEVPSHPRSPKDGRLEQVIVLSAKTPTALEKMTSNLIRYFQENPNIDLADAAWTLQVGRKEFDYRRMVVCKTIKQAIKLLPQAKIVHIKKRQTKRTKKQLKFGAGDQLGQAWLNGERVDWALVYRNKERKKIFLPTYPFEHQRYWPIENKSDEPKIYLPIWREKSRHFDSLAASNDWLIFCDDYQLKKEIGRQLDVSGQKAIFVQSARKFKESGQEQFSINPRRRTDYDRLFLSLKNSGFVPGKIIYALNLSRDANKRLKEPLKAALSRIKKSQELGFQGLIYLYQSLNKFSEGASVSVLTNKLHKALAGEKMGRPEQALILGPLKLSGKEYANIKSRNIDLDLGLEKPALEASIKNLINETIDPDGETIMVYRGNRRFVQRFKPEKEYRAPEDIAQKLPNNLKPNGVYLILGGLGAIGFTAAKELARLAKINLVLIGRTNLPARKNWEKYLENHPVFDPISIKINRIKELESMGARVEVFSVDVSDYIQMKKTFFKIRRLFGQINGVVQSAGSVDYGGIMQKRFKPAKDNGFLSKVQGAIILDDLLRQQTRPLDFFVICSSISSITAPVGEVGYVAANSFLDAYARYRSGHDKIGHCFAINWIPWHGIGMSVQAERQRSGFSEQELIPINISSHYLFQKRLKNKNAEVFVAHLDPEKNWFLSEHRIAGRITMPGSAWLEMVRSAVCFQKKGGFGQILFEEAQFIEPLFFLDEKEKEIRIVLEAEHQKGARRKFFILSRDSSSHLFKKHAEGVFMRVAVQANFKRDGEEYFLESFKGKNIKIDGRKKDSDFFSFGPRWDNVKEVAVKPGRAIAKIELDKKFLKDLKSYQLHPAMLDRATSIFRKINFPGYQYLPFTYRGVRIHCPLTKEIKSYLFLKERGSDAEILSFQVLITDKKGKKLVEIEEIVLKRADEDSLEPKSGHGREKKSFFAFLSDFNQTKEVKMKKVWHSGSLSPEQGASLLAKTIARKQNPPQLIIALDGKSDYLNSGSEVHAANKNDEDWKTDSPKSLILARGSDQVIEDVLIKIWQEYFGHKNVASSDNIFDLGATSLDIISVNAKIEKQLGMDLPLETIFQFPIIGKLSHKLKEQQKGLEGKKEENVAGSKLSGGTPFTAAGDWLIDNQKESFGPGLVILENRPFDLSLFKNALIDANRRQPGLKVCFVSDLNTLEKRKLDISNKDFFHLANQSQNDKNLIDQFEIAKRFAGLSSKGELVCLVINNGELFRIFFDFHSSIPQTQFGRFLKNVQRLYNLKLIGLNYRDLETETYTPLCSYPEYYSCFFTGITEKKRWLNKDNFFYKSLVPAQHLACLPSYRVMAAGNRADIDSDLSLMKSVFLGYGKPYNYDELKFSQEKEALDYYNRIQEDIPMLLGSSKDLPFRREMFLSVPASDGISIVPYNISLFFGRSDQNSIIYPINLSYFGRITEADFLNYWRGAQIEGEPSDIPSFRLLEIKGLADRRTETASMLEQALVLNAKEYFKARTIDRGERSRKFNKIHFGRRALSAYKKDVRDNLNGKKECISDIMLLDLSRRMQKSYLFLKDALRELSCSNRSFKGEFDQAVSIILQWDSVHKKISELAYKKELPYVFRWSFLPGEELKKIKFLSRENKKELLRALEKIELASDLLMDSLNKKCR